MVTGDGDFDNNDNIFVAVSTPNLYLKFPKFKKKYYKKIIQYCF